MPLSCVRRGVCCVVSCCDEGRGKEEGVRKPGASEALSSRRGSLWLISKTTDQARTCAQGRLACGSEGDKLTLAAVWQLLWGHASELTRGKAVSICPDPQPR